jgi:hypothetical protein
MWNDALPRNGITNWSVFYGNGESDSSGQRPNVLQFKSWVKPAGVSWVYIFAIGAGSGGGYRIGSGTAAGAGGGSGAVSRLLIPATLIPDCNSCCRCRRWSSRKSDIRNGESCSTFLCLYCAKYDCSKHNSYC